MKKIITFIIVSFLFIGSTSALTSDEQLTNLQNNIKLLQEKVEEVENSRLDKTYPVGSIYITTSYSTASQVKSAIGGTWEAYGSGRTLIGVNANDTNFNTVNKTGGTINRTLAITNMPSHSHSIPSLSGTAASAGAHNHKFKYAAGYNIYYIGYPYSSVVGEYVNFYLGNSNNSSTLTSIANSDNHTHNVTTNKSSTESSGGGTSFTNLPPYITVYMWKRVS